MFSIYYIHIYNIYNSKLLILYTVAEYIATKFRLIPGNIFSWHAMAEHTPNNIEYLCKIKLNSEPENLLPEDIAYRSGAPQISIITIRNHT